ncbi:MAG: solute carrier family 23 protein, partial [Clostridium sp.]
ENTGVLAITKNYDPSLLRLTAVFAILLSFVAKFGMIIRTIPEPVMGGISLMLFSMIALIGFKTIKLEKVELNKKNGIVISLIVFAGLIAPQLNPMLLENYGFIIGIKISGAVALEGLSFAALVGVISNLIINGISKVSEQEKEEFLEKNLA